MKFNSTFVSLITEPLEAMLGKVLHKVDYWIAYVDEPTFLMEAPNDSGIFAIGLSFDEESLCLTWGWKAELRDRNTTYHIEVMRPPGNGNVAEWSRSENLRHRDASQAAPWREALSQRLTCVEVFGPQQTPQAIRFCFEAICLVVTTGSSGETPFVSDGDELLVFADAQWLPHMNGQPEEWAKIWELTQTSWYENGLWKTTYD